MKSNIIALTAVVSEKLRFLKADEWVVHNEEFMELLDMSRKTFEKTRKHAIDSEYITYSCRGTVKAGVYKLHSKWVEFTHMGNIYPYYIYNNISINNNICYGEKLPIVKSTPNEFDSIWPSLRANDRSNKAQSLTAWKNCRKKYSAEQIKTAWQAKLASYSDPQKWACGFQVFAKPDNIGDWLNKPKYNSGKTEYVL